MGKEEKYYRDLYNRKYGIKNNPHWKIYCATCKYRQPMCFEETLSPSDSLCKNKNNIVFLDHALVREAHFLPIREANKNNDCEFYQPTFLRISKERWLLMFVLSIIVGIVCFGIALVIIFVK